MKTLVTWIEENGFNAADLTIEVTLTRAFTETKRHAISEKLCDHYNRKFLKLKIGDVVLTETEQPAPFTADDFTDICSTIDLEYSLPMHEVLIDHETQDTAGLDLNQIVTVEINAGELIIRWETFDAILFAKTEEEGDEAAWKRFQTTDVFKKNPCQREKYMFLRKSFLDRLGGLDFAAYYGWYFRSAARLTPEGDKVNDETMKEVHRVLELLKDRGDLEHRQYVVCRTFEAHPLHKPIFKALVQE